MEGLVFGKKTLMQWENRIERVVSAYFCFLNAICCQGFSDRRYSHISCTTHCKRGGHNKFKAFTIDYPSLIVGSYMKGHISLNCKDSILKDICTQYLPTLLFNKYIVRIETFDATGYRENIKRYFLNMPIGQHG